MTQQFHRKGGQLTRMTWSKNLTWSVHLEMDNRGNIHEMQAMCTYGRGDLASIGHAHQRVGPFDDVDQVLEQLMVDSAIACSEQMTLFDRP